MRARGAPAGAPQRLLPFLTAVSPVVFYHFVAHLRFSVEVLMSVTKLVWIAVGLI